MRLMLLMTCGLLLSAVGLVAAEVESPKPVTVSGLTFSSLTADVHAAADADVVTANFAFENKTSETVFIKSMDVHCSCLSANVVPARMLKDGIAPGDKGVISSKFKLGTFQGTIEKAIGLLTKKDTTASIHLVVRVHIPVLFQIEPKTMVWPLNGEAKAKSFQITVNHDKPINILSHRISNKDFPYEVKVIEPGKKYEVVVTPKNMTQQGLGVLSFVTDCDVKRHARQQAFVVVRKPIPKPKDL